MANTYEDVVPSLIANTTMRKLFINGVHRTYNITPIAGYVLHDNARDWEEMNPENPEETIFTRGYTTGTASCAAAYDFGAVTVIDGYAAIGTREFFARPETEVPENQIFGGGNNHEVM